MSDPRKNAVRLLAVLLMSFGTVGWGDNGCGDKLTLDSPQAVSGVALNRAAASFGRGRAWSEVRSEVQRIVDRADPALACRVELRAAAGERGTWLELLHVSIVLREGEEARDGIVINEAKEFRHREIGDDVLLSLPGRASQVVSWEAVSTARCQNRLYVTGAYSPNPGVVTDRN